MVTLAVRGLSNLAQAARGWSARPARTMVVAAAALVGDLVIAAAHRRRQPVRYTPRIGLDAATTAGWAASGAMSAEAWMPAYTGISMANSIEVGFNEFALPPRSPDLASEATGRALLETLLRGLRLTLPLVAPAVPLLATGRLRARDLTWATAPAVGTLVCGAQFARLRTREHARARELWDQRATAELERHRFSARYQAATENHEAHNFKRVLYAIGTHSPACWRAARVSAAFPAQLADTSVEGMTLAEAARYHDIRPAAAGATWLTDDQTNQLRRFIEAAEAEPTADDSALAVRRHLGGEIEVGYFGHQRTLNPARPTFDATFDPIAAAFLGATLYRLASIHPNIGGFRPSTALGLGGLDTVVFLLVARRPAATERPIRAMVLGAAASTLAWCGAVVAGHAAETTPTGERVNPGMAGMSALGLVGYYWDDLGPLRWVVGIGLYAAFLSTMLTRRTGADVGFIASELLVVSQFLFGFAGLRRHLAAERDDIGDELEEEFIARSHAARHAAFRREQDRIAGLVDLAESELDRLANDSTVQLDDEDTRIWRAEIAGMRTWIASPGS